MLKEDSLDILVGSWNAALRLNWFLDHLLVVAIEPVEGQKFCGSVSCVLLNPCVGIFHGFKVRLDLNFLLILHLLNGKV